MNCSRCGAEGAADTEGMEPYCADCAAKRDWQALIALVQDAHVAEPVEDAPPLRLAADGR